MLKPFRAIEILEDHLVRLALLMFENEVAFLWESALVTYLVTNFVRREFNTITWLESPVVFNVRYYAEWLKEQKS